MKLLRVGTLMFVCQAVMLEHAASGAEPKPRRPAAAATADGAPVVRQTNITLAKETTRITGPLTDEGYPDYLEHLNRQYSRGATPENNAVVLLWQVVGPKEVNALLREEYFRRLGVPAPAEMGEYLLEMEGYAKSAGLIRDGEDGMLLSHHHESYRRPWMEKEFPLMAKWLAASKAPLKLAVEMTQRPRYYAPLVTTAKSCRLVAVLLPSVQVSRRIGRALISRAMLRLGENNLEGAWEDVMAVRRLSRLVDQGPFLVDGLVAIAINGFASDAESAIMHFGRPTGKQIVRFRQQRSAVAPLAGFARRLGESERLVMLECMCNVERHGPSVVSALYDSTPAHLDTSNGLLFRTLLNSCVDWDAALKQSNHVFDRYTAAAGIRDWQKRARVLQGYEKQVRLISMEVPTLTPFIPLLALGGKGGRTLAGRLVTGYGVALLLPAATAVFEAERRTETIERRGEIVLALAEYRADRGSYPADLTDLVPKYLKTMPRDTYTDAEFNYERKGDGFRLYSLGINGVDDDGRGQFDNDKLGGPMGDDWLLTMPPPKPKAMQ